MEKMFDECKVYVSSGTVAASNIANKFRAWELHCRGQHASSPLVACGYRKNYGPAASTGRQRLVPFLKRTKKQRKRTAGISRAYTFFSFSATACLHQTFHQLYAKVAPYSNIHA